QGIDDPKVLMFPGQFPGYSGTPRMTQEYHRRNPAGACAICDVAAKTTVRSSQDVVFHALKA
ncbi:MAG: hypothetical protein M3082_15830, partial [Candidatus Dormibacteraeota bacterium]|nr:hypothetical protein [Candidatus Dormibacteraeota bacterium]